MLISKGFIKLIWDRRKKNDLISSESKPHQKYTFTSEKSLRDKTALNYYIFITFFPNCKRAPSLKISFE